MQTLILALQFNFLYTTFLNITWARGDRALFSIDNKTYFTNEINSIIATYEYLKCKKLPLDNLKLIFNDEFLSFIKSPKLSQSSDGFKIETFNYQEIRSALEAIKLVKAIKISKRESRRDVTRDLNCGYVSGMRFNIPYIIGLHEYISDQKKIGKANNLSEGDSLRNFFKDLNAIKERRFFHE